MATAVREHAQSGLRALRARLDDLDGRGLERDLDALGYATTGPLLTPEECAAVAAMYGEPARFRSRIDMRRHAFGEGEYQYFAYPLPEIVAELRHATYPRLAPIANRWSEALGRGQPYPPDLDGYLDLCHQAARDDRRRCCSSMGRVTTIACIRISTVSFTSRCRWRSC